ncbi:2-oxo-4-hydroxy-4-carboxy-5-ureidoimidazoline decarboxylase [Salinisphaera sp. SPP-AMP-43]|uniref:2-oxo-4-hydroxy-4-carboxy-5-ureidoimidazoline decarboxylase n=1 Tax=Salinisphaera sp. SPP-AMP-43 TaxID=3121288 RepID=UPI003C6E4F1B
MPAMSEHDLQNQDTRQLEPRPSHLDQAAFVAEYGGIYEHSPWVAQTAWDAGLSPAQDTVDGLAAVLRTAVDRAAPAARLALINAHPDLGGKAAMRGELTAGSTQEQAGAGLDQCTPAEYKRLQALNTAYRERFGFVFILAVRGLGRPAILAAMAQRLDNDPTTEFETAIAEIHKIARLRLAARAGGSG